MRGLYSSKTEIRHKIFTEIARMAYEGQSPETLEELPYKIVKLRLIVTVFFWKER